MFRKTMIALFAVASVSMLAPDLAWARGGGGHGGGGGGGGGGGRGGSFGGGFSGARAGGVGGASFGAARIGGSAFQGGVSNSFARSTAIGPAGVQGNRFAAVQGNRFAGRGFRHDHDGFRHHGRRFFVGGFYGPDYYDDYYDYPYYTADDSYYDNGGCYVVQRRVHTRYGWRLRPVQVCG
jgi:hypothetical protein